MTCRHQNRGTTEAKTGPLRPILPRSWPEVGEKTVPFVQIQNCCIARRSLDNPQLMWYLVNKTRVQQIAIFWLDGEDKAGHAIIQRTFFIHRVIDALERALLCSARFLLLRREKRVLVLVRVRENSPGGGNAHGSHHLAKLARPPQIGATDFFMPRSKQKK